MKPGSKIPGSKDPKGSQDPEFLRVERRSEWTDV